MAFSLPRHHHDYLRFLAEELHAFGNSPNEAAKFLLMREIERLREGRYHRPENSD